MFTQVSVSISNVQKCDRSVEELREAESKLHLVAAYGDNK